MNIKPSQIIAALALIGALAFGGVSLASAQESSDNSTSTTVVDGSSSSDTPTADPGHCHHDGDRGPGGLDPIPTPAPSSSDSGTPATGSANNTAA